MVERAIQRPVLVLVWVSGVEQRAPHVSSSDLGYLSIELDCSMQLCPIALGGCQNSGTCDPKTGACTCVGQWSGSTCSTCEFFKLDTFYLSNLIVLYNDVRSL